MAGARAAGGGLAGWLPVWLAAWLHRMQHMHAGGWLAGWRRCRRLAAHFLRVAAALPDGMVHRDVDFDALELIDVRLEIDAANLFIYLRENSDFPPGNAEVRINVEGLR